MKDEVLQAGSAARSETTEPYFHAGERQIQVEAGVDTDAYEAFGAQVMDPELVGHEIAFVEGRSFSLAATIDSAGRPWLSPLFGHAGDLFTVRDATSVTIRPDTNGDELLQENVEATGELGVLFFDPSRRRRAKSLGTGIVADDGSIHYTMTRYFGLCPKYIFRRSHEPSLSQGNNRGESLQREDLTGVDRAQLTASDTIFLASHHDGHGADATHRGGQPGFLRVLDATTIEIPDYVGNGMFNTIGNLMLDTRLALTAVDFSTGRTIQITGAARVSRTPGTNVHGGPVRIITLSIDEVRTSSVDAGRWTDLEPSPYSMRYPVASRRLP